MREQTYHANWSLAFPRREYKPPTSPQTSDSLTWSNGWAASGTYLDMIDEQYKKGQERVWKGAKTGLGRGKNGIGMGQERD